MSIRCIWEHNGNDTLLYAADYPGAFARGADLGSAIAKMPRELAAFTAWAGTEMPYGIKVEIIQEAVCTLQVCDADSEVLFDREKAPLSSSEYLQMRALALKSAGDFLTLYQSVPEPSLALVPLRKTFYGQVPRTAEEMYHHTMRVNAYYFGEIGVEADNEGDILACRRRGFEQLEQGDFLSNPTFSGSYGEMWTLRKLLRRFIWHDRIHARAMYRAAVAKWGSAAIADPFGLEITITPHI